MCARFVCTLCERAYIHVCICVRIHVCICVRTRQRDDSQPSAPPQPACAHASHVTHHTSHVTRHTSHVSCYTSHITRHTSHITHHTPHVTRTSRVHIQCALNCECIILCAAAAIKHNYISYCCRLCNPRATNCAITPPNPPLHLRAQRTFATSDFLQTA